MTLTIERHEKAFLAILAHHHGFKGVNVRATGLVLLFHLDATIAQPFMAGNIATQFSESRQGRQALVAVRKDLSSLTGLETFPNREPSHKWLGYCQRRGRSRTTKPRPACQSGSLSGNAQMSRRRLAMTLRHGRNIVSARADTSGSRDDIGGRRDFLWAVRWSRCCWCRCRCW